LGYEKLKHNIVLKSYPQPPHILKMNHTLNYNWFKTEYANTNMYLELSLDVIITKNCRLSGIDSFYHDLHHDELEDELEDRVNFIPNYRLKQKSSISNFFSSNLIDIPRCFRNSYSLYKPIYETPHLKFLNILMRHGRKEKIFTTILRIFVSKNLHPTHPRTSILNYSSWLTLSPILSTLLVNNSTIFTSFTFNKWCLSSLQQNIQSEYITTRQPLTMSNFLTSKLGDYKPTFMFKVQKVDKSTRKHSRGKSGKYVILWKYVPVYKRLYTVLRWLIQDMTFQKARKFELKFWQALNLVSNASKNSLIIKFRNFNHNFVFKNFKKTLLQNLNTVS